MNDENRWRLKVALSLIVLLIVFLLIFVKSVSALDNQTYVACGGDSQLTIGCVGDSQNSFFGGTITIPSGGNPSPPPNSVGTGSYKYKIEVDYPKEILVGQQFTVKIRVLDQSGKIFKVSNITFFPETNKINLTGYNSDGFITNALFETNDISFGKYNLTVSINNRLNQTVSLNMVEKVSIQNTEADYSKIRNYIIIVGSLIIIALIIILGVVTKKKQKKKQESIF